MIMTFEEYDEMVEKFDQISTNLMWPTTEQFLMMEKNSDKWIPFLCYLSEKNPEPETEEEAESKKMLRLFINKHLELVDSEDL